MKKTPAITELFNNHLKPSLQNYFMLSHNEHFVINLLNNDNHDKNFIVYRPEDSNGKK